MAREALGRTYGLPIYFDLDAGQKAIIGRLLSCNYLVTVAHRKKLPAFILAWTLDASDNRLHTDPLLISESSGFSFYNENQNRRFEIHAPASDMAVSIVPFFGTNPPADQAGPTTVPSINITDI